MASVSGSQLRQLPKADLHSHIDGSVPFRDILRIARLRGRRLATREGREITSVSGLADHVRGAGYSTLLDDIVDRFFPITGLMQTQEALRDVGVAYVKELQSNGVAYAEGRFAPQYHQREGLSVDEAIQAMQEGLAEGCERFGVRVNLIVAIGRESERKLAEGIARAAVRNRAVVAIDLSGQEAGHPPEAFESSFAMATAAGVKKTVHAGEGAESTAQNLANIRTAVTRLGADRVGHAIDLVRDQALVSLLAERDVTVEMNPVSNRVLQKIRSPAELGIDRLLERGVRVTVNSDDPALWPHGSVGDALLAVCRAYKFGIETVDRLIANAFDGAFVSEGERESLREMYRTAKGRMS